MVLPFDNTRRSRGSQIEILTSFAERIREIPTLNDQNVVIADQPTPKSAPTGGRFQIIVSYGDGRFPNSSHSEFIENSSLVVALYAISKRDKLGRSESKMLGDDSITQYKHRVLSKLLVDDPTKRNLSRPWEPTRVMDGLRVPILRDPPTISHCTGPSDCWSDWIGIQIHWNIVFDWELYDVS